MGIVSSSAAHLRRHADVAGAAASTACLAHCLLTPLIIGIFPNIIPYIPGDASFHRLLAAGVVLCGLAAFVPGYLEHRRKPLLALIATGMPLILVVAWSGEGMSRTLELLVSLTGSALLINAHLLNRSFCRQCRTCKEHEGVCNSTGIQ